MYIQKKAILLPHLFALFLNDLNDVLKQKDSVDVDANSITLLTYADDIVLVSNIVEGL